MAKIQGSTNIFIEDAFCSLISYKDYQKHIHTKQYRILQVLQKTKKLSNYLLVSVGSPTRLYDLP